MRALLLAALLLAAPEEPIRVRVRSFEEGTAIDGVRVAAMRVNGEGPFDPDAVLGGQGTPSLDSNWPIRVPVPPGEGRILLAAVAPGYAPALAWPSTDGDPRLLLLRRAAALEIAAESAPSAEPFAPAAGARPVPGAAVEIRLEAGYEPEGTPPMVRRATTGTGGAVRIPDLPRGPFHDVEVRAKGFAPARASRVLAGGEALRVGLVPAARVVGRVVRVPGGGPVAGARVRGGGGEVVSGSDGGFALEDLVPGRVAVTAEKEGTLALDAPVVEAPAGRTTAVPDLRLAVLGSVKILVQGPGGKPLARVPVRLLPPRPGMTDPSARTGSAGDVSLGPVVPAPGHRLVIEPESDFAPRVTDAFAVLPGEAVDLGAVRLDGGGVVEGRVEGPDGFPVPGATVLLFDGAEDPLRAAADPAAGGPLRREIPAAADGTFRFDRVPSGSRSLLARAPGRLPAASTRLVVAAGRTEPGVRLVLRPGAAVTGLLRGPEGEPVADALLVALAPLTGAEIARARTGPGGTFRLDGLPAGSCSIRVVLPGEDFPDPLRPLFPARVPFDGLDIDLPRSRSVEGVVLDPSGGEVRGVVVVVRLDRSAREVERVPLAADGAFATRPLPEGRWRLRAESPDGRVATADVEVGGDAPPRVVLTLALGATVRGRVVTGPAVKDLREVSLRLLLGGRGEASVPAAAIESSGAFALPGVPAGEHDLVVALPGLAPVVLRGVLVPPEGGVVDVGDVLLGLGATLRVRVYGESRGPLAGAAAAVEDPSGLRREEQTNAAGLALFPGLPAGDVVVEVRVPPGVVLRRLLLMPGEGEREEVVDLALLPAGTVEVRREDGPVPGALVRITAGADTTDAVADDRGVARLPGLPDGPVEVEVTPPGEPAVRLRLTAANGRLAVLLPADGIEGLVLSAAKGEPIPGALLRAWPEGPGGIAPEVKSDGKGRFRFPSLPAGNWTLEASARGFGAARTPAIRVLRGGGPTPVRVLLEAAGRVAGLVLDPTGRPVPGGTVEATDPATGDLLPGGRRAADAAGRYAFEDLAPGTWILTARAGGLGASPPEVAAVGPGESRALDLRLLPGGTLEVRVVGPGGRAVADALVEVRDFFGAPIPLEADVTGSDGLLRVPGLRAGVYVVSASKEDLAAEVRVRVDVRGGSKAVVALLPE